MARRLALISVYDKVRIVEFTQFLVEIGYTILSTGGTAKALRAGGVSVTDVSEHTGFPEIMGGRVKTLHPKIHGGLLCRRNDSEHRSEAAENEIQLIDVIVVNLYPFEQTIAKAGVTKEEAIEQIDIGGPSMIRSGAKNHESVTVIVDPVDYVEAMRVLKEGNPEEALAFRERMAAKVFAVTGKYDTAIANFLLKQN